MFGKLCRIEELLKGRDGNVRTANVKVPTDKGNTISIRPLRHLIPIEIKSEQSTNTKADTPFGSTPAHNDSYGSPIAAAGGPLASRPRRKAAIVGELLRQNIL